MERHSPPPEISCEERSVLVIDNYATTRMPFKNGAFNLWASGGRIPPPRKHTRKLECDDKFLPNSAHAPTERFARNSAPKFSPPILQILV
jgi:hypothetical protein